MAGTYARELAVRSYAALAFDFTGWGQIEETPRYVEDSATKTADIRVAAAFIVPLDKFDPARISGLGICVSSGYMAAAVADDDRFQRVALVAPWLHGPAMAEGIYGGADAVAGLIAASEAEDATDTVLLGDTDTNAVMVRAPCYTEEDRGLIPAYDNKFSVASWKPWLAHL